MKEKGNVPQLVILGVLILALIGYIGIKLMKPKATEAAAPDKKSKTQTTAKTTVGSAKPEWKVESNDQTFVVAQNAAKRDPFAPAFTPPIIDNRSNTVAFNPPSRIRTPDLPPFRPLPAFGEPMSVKPMGGSVTAVENIGTAQPEVPSYRLTGIIRGESNVAIIRGGESARYIVREGQYLDGKYKVLDVKDNSVIIKLGTDWKELKLGGESNAS